MLKATGMALLLWVARRKKNGSSPLSPIVEGEKRDKDVKELLDLLDEHDLILDVRAENALHQGLTQRWLEQNISRLNGQLRKALGPELAERCKLASRRFGKGKAYALPDELDITIRK